MDLKPIIITDDDADDRTMLAEAFERILHQQRPIIQVPGGNELLCLVSELIAAPQLMIIDMIMPSMTGIELLDKLRASAVLGQVPVVFFSDDKYNLPLAYQVGADGFYSKPADMDGFTLVAADITRLFL